MSEGNSPFPPFRPPGLGREDVVAFLVDLKQQGWPVFEAEGGWFVVRMGVDGHGAEKLVRIGRVRSGWEVSCNGFLGQWQLCGRPTSLPELSKSMGQAAAFLDIAGWPDAQPTSVRLDADQPASNVHRISSLVGTAWIVAVFDPYLDNAGLQALADIASFGSPLSRDIRLLSSPRVNEGRSPRLTTTYVESWLRQNGSPAGELRLMASANEHRRFLLVSGGRSLILGPSLNSLSKNEAASIEPDAEDRAFFERMWADANAFARAAG